MRQVPAPVPCSDCYCDKDECFTQCQQEYEPKPRPSNKPWWPEPDGEFLKIDGKYYYKGRDGVLRDQFMNPVPDGSTVR